MKVDAGMTHLLLLDTETTGVSKEDTPVQVAALLVDIDTLEIKDKFETLVDPQREIHPKAQEVHGISQADVEGKPTLQQVWQDLKFRNFVMESTFVVGHNVKFDLAMMGEDKFQHLKVLDTLTLARFLFQNLPNHKLQTLVNRLLLPKRDAHDAMGDVLSTLDFMRYVQDTHRMNVQQMYDTVGQIKSYYRNLIK